MTDNLPTIWNASAHTLAKHQILKTYLGAWMPIMSREVERRGEDNRSLLFVDGFAGPGVYEGGELGSPILALKSVIEHRQDFPIPVRFLFIENDKERFAELEKSLHGIVHETSKCTKIAKIVIKRGSCEDILNDGFDEYEKRSCQIGPALFFLDQFGYSDVPMELVKRIMSKKWCEVFSYLNWDRMQQFTSDESKWKSISSAFGGDEWREVLTIPHSKRTGFMLQEYKKAMKAKAQVRYIWHFAMCNNNDKLVYWLFFCTNNLRGLEEMKRAMWSVDSTGGFRYSDRDDPLQMNLFEKLTDDALAEELTEKLCGKNMTVAEIKEFVLTETASHKFKGALNNLERRDRIVITDAPAKRRTGTYSDETIRITFK